VEFKALVAEEDAYPTPALWLRAQTLWVHPKIFELIDVNNTQEAGKLAIDIIKALPFESSITGEVETDSVNQAHCLVAFLWAVENHCATKVSLNDAPTSELFDNRAQEIVAYLDPENRSKSRAASVRHTEEEEESSSSDQSKKQQRKNNRRRGRNQGKGAKQRGDTRPDEIIIIVGTITLLAPKIQNQSLVLDCHPVPSRAPAPHRSAHPLAVQSPRPQIPEQGNRGSSGEILFKLLYSRRFEG
jgi:hypothetical protein